MSAVRKKKAAKEKSHQLHDTVSYVDKAGFVPKEQREKYLEFVVDLADNDRDITKNFTSNKQWLDHVLKLRKKHKVHPRKAQLKALYQECLANQTLLEPNYNLEQYLTIKQSRSLSGVLVIAVLMSPYPVYLDKKTGKVKQQRFSCAHNCYYCPNEPGMPRSYLSTEAAVSRAIRADFDAIDQFYSRANTLKKLGHDVDKIELLVLGGTFCQFPQEYQEQFIRDLFWSANTFYDGISDFSMKRPRKTLSEEIKIHETATKCRIVGLTLETRPDTIRDFQTIRRFREYGATRLQIGVQHTDDEILKYINRGCYNQDTITAVRLLKNCGYKIDIHLMPNLPGSDPEKDRAMFKNLLSDELIQCDQWKVYPCQTVDYSLIQKWYEKGIYKPYSLEELMNVVIGMKSKIHPWIRLNRIFRSLPEQHITSGITMSNFRQHMYLKMNERGLKCKCIRCREIGTHIRREEIAKKQAQRQQVAPSSDRLPPKVMDLKKKLSKPAVLKRRQYKSSGGEEVFISFESEDEEILFGFVRLRLPPIYIKPEHRREFGLNDGEAFLNEFNLSEDGRHGVEKEYAELIETFPELYQAALVREAHVYGAKQNVKKTSESVSGFGGSANLGSSDSANVGHESETNAIREEQNLTGQSKGYGSKLMTEAERIAKDHGYSRVVVIAGVGTRLYYRLKLGYKSAGTYMVKDFSECSIGRGARQNVNKLNIAMIKTAAIISAALCLAMYALSYVLSVFFSLVLSAVFLAYLNYLHFVKIKHAKTVNKSLLRLSRIGLLAIDLAVSCKFGSVFFPHISGVPVPYLIRELIGGTEKNDGGPDGDCYCRTYWSISLVSYVLAFYILKLIYHKRVIILVQNPMFGNDSGLRSVPLSITALLLGQILAFTLCQFLMLNYTRSTCTDQSETMYDQQSPFGCHDQFDAIDCWVAMLAITFDAVLFSVFCGKWYAIMLIFMEEMATSLLVQFSLVIIGMLSCITDALAHLWLIYRSKSKSSYDPEFDSFLATPAFLIDCLVIATCIVLSFTDSQRFLLKKIGITKLKTYYQSLESIGYTLHVF